MECASCHQDRNLVQARMPGPPDWHLAPREMAWSARPFLLSASNAEEDLQDDVDFQQARSSSQ
jgi:hypothetical protein